MNSNQEEDEFVAVRVQDPRMQNEGSWNSYVDYKIFLHTNSKAFTAKTSCVRRRYSEFAWLKKKLQKNAGLVPVPELPGKYFFFLSNEDFLERRRKGLQVFLDNVVNMTVCLSDSQLHLFLQTQLPVGHILDCVQGHTPYSVTDAILTYASSNRGYAQAQEEDSVKEPSLTVSYESMESPAPHQPQDIFNPERLSHDVSDPPEGLTEICDEDAVELRREENPSVLVVQKNNHLQAVVEDHGPAEATFFLGDGRDALDGLGLAEPTQQRSCRTRIQTPVEVHSPMEAGLFDEERPVREEEETTGPPPQEEEEDQPKGSGEAKTDRDFEERATESDARSQEEILDDVRSKLKVLETQCEVSQEEFKDPDGQSESEEETPLQIQEETRDVLGVPEDEGGGGGLVQQMDRGNADGDGRSSSSESIVKVSDDESIGDTAEDAVQDSIDELIQDSIHESNQDSIHQPDQDSIHQPDQDSIYEFIKDSIHESQHSIQESIQDSIQDSIHESIQDSIQDSTHESFHKSNQDSIHKSNQYSIHDSLQDSNHESQDSIQSASGDGKEAGLWSPVESSSRNILDLHTNGRSVEREDDVDLEDTTGASGDSLEQNSTLRGGDLTESSDFSVIESGAAGPHAEPEDESSEETSSDR